MKLFIEESHPAYFGGGFAIGCEEALLARGRGCWLTCARGAATSLFRPNAILTTRQSLFESTATPTATLRCAGTAPARTARSTATRSSSPRRWWCSRAKACQCRLGSIKCHFASRQVVVVFGVVVSCRFGAKNFQKSRAHSKLISTQFPEDLPPSFKVEEWYEGAQIRYRLEARILKPAEPTKSLCMTGAERYDILRDRHVSTFHFHTPLNSSPHSFPFL